MFLKAANAPFYGIITAQEHQYSALLALDAPIGYARCEVFFKASTVIDTTFIDELSQRVSTLLPPGIQVLKADFEKNIKLLLQNTFAQLEVVTREEFEVQNAVLTRTREKLNQLEQQVAQLEAQFVSRAKVSPKDKLPSQTDSSDES